MTIYIYDMYIYIYAYVYIYIHVVHLLLFFAVLVGALLPLQAPLQYGEPPWQTPKTFGVPRGVPAMIGLLLLV